MTIADTNESFVVNAFPEGDANGSLASVLRVQQRCNRKPLSEENPPKHRVRLENKVRFFAKLENCANHPKSCQISAILNGVKMAAILMTAIEKNVNSK
ncbi:hypothetical protein AVEN_102213-1 [Araneus ventricosus]|uniref:Uncharacterized protein n=1 Tax=Araneus ventricosus TaxID=182803 RepID=A0A4Y2NGL1_ARAVE|nr:hypothetical protein AVEN_102213-1 [Araneus ventricosus]